jgi:transcriptional regulator with XRE-family HTH domain
VRLARRLRDLRESQQLTQSVLACALSTDSRVVVATISSWESLSNPKLPPEDRLRAYALLFCRASTGSTPPRVWREDDLSAGERERFQNLLRGLLALRDAVRQQPESSLGTPYSFDFESGRITIVCPELPDVGRSPLADKSNPNHTRLYRYADLDALVEMWGHVRSSNPEHRAGHRLPAELTADHLPGHLILLGGIGWNKVTSRLLRVLDVLPIRQVAVPEQADGEVFRSRDGAEYRPLWEEGDDAGLEDPTGASVEMTPQDSWCDGKPLELVEDVALLARLRNPFNHSRTITICTGVYSRGVLGAVRTLTDEAVREQNEAYIAHRFPSGSFAVLMRVPVVNGEALTPDLEIPDNRLFEWSPEETGQ